MRRLLAVFALIMLTAAAGMCQIWPHGASDDSHMWYRGYFEGPVQARNTPQPGYYYQPSPNTTRPLHEKSHTYPLICPNCGSYYYPGTDACRRCNHDLPGRAQGVGRDTVYAPDRLPGQYWYKEQPHRRFLTAPRLSPYYQRYQNRWD